MSTSEGRISREIEVESTHPEIGTATNGKAKSPP